MEIKTILKKEDYEKILTDANQLIKECAINLMVYESTAELARTHIKKFADDGKNKKKSDGNSEEVHSAVKESKCGS